MAQPFLSSSWYRVASLRPRLRPHAQIHRHRYRGQVWYVLEDLASGRTHRFSPAAYTLLGLMDGSRTVDEIWTETARRTAADAPSQDEVINLLGQLHAADMLQSEVSPDAVELFRRHGKQKRAHLFKSFLNPLAFRIPLWDPDEFLTRTLPLVRPLIGWFGLLLWLAVVVPAAVLAGVHWSELTGNLSDRVLAAQNLVLLWLVFPVVKALHELGHAYLTKAGGGEVHDLGIMILVLAPIPYVDASSANAFPSKGRRIAVGAAGMLVETFLAALAMYVWVAVEPGLIRTVAFNVMLIAGVSTLIFNANPLLRYDGYYMLADWLEIPNLATRSARYWAFLAERYAFRVDIPEGFPAARGEKPWLAVYAVLSFCYRMFVMFAIALFVATQFFFVGVLVALWAVATAVVWPIIKILRYLLTSPRLHRYRRRAYWVTGAAVALLVVLTVVLPVPHRTAAEGVVWLPEDAHVRAGADGFLSRLLVEPGAAVKRGDPLAVSEDLVLAAEVETRQGRVEELETRLAGVMFADRAKAEIAREELATEQAALERALERSERLVARAGMDGSFVVAQAEDLPGRFFRKGEVIGYVTQGSARVARVVVEQGDIDLVRQRLRGVDIKLADRLAETYAVRILREVPAAQEELPSKALGTEGGGRVAQDPRDPKGTKALARVFQFDLELPASLPQVTLGSRVFVRFDHRREPLAAQVYRRVRQLFLVTFHV